MRKKIASLFFLSWTTLLSPSAGLAQNRLACQRVDAYVSKEVLNTVQVFPGEEIILPDRINIGACHGACAFTTPRGVPYYQSLFHGLVTTRNAVEVPNGREVDDQCCAAMTYRSFSFIVRNLTTNQLAIKRIDDFAVNSCECVQTGGR